MRHRESMRPRRRHPGQLTLDALADDPASGFPRVTDCEEARFDLLLGEVPARLALRQSGQGDDQRHEVEELFVAPLLLLIDRFRAHRGVPSAWREEKTLRSF